MINTCKATPLDAICHCVYHHFSLLCLHEPYIPVVAVVVVVVVDDDDDDEVMQWFIYIILLPYFQKRGQNSSLFDWLHDYET